MEGSVAATTSSGDGTGHGMVSNQLAMLVPSFDPGKDDLQIYQQKVELLCATWPENRFGELATRLVLNTTGTAFQKLQQHQLEVTANDKSAVKRIIALLGGIHGDRFRWNASLKQQKRPSFAVSRKAMSQTTHTLPDQKFSGKTSCRKV